MSDEGGRGQEVVGSLLENTTTPATTSELRTDGVREREGERGLTYHDC